MIKRIDFEKNALTCNNLALDNGNLKFDVSSNDLSTLKAHVFVKRFLEERLPGKRNDLKDLREICPKASDGKEFSTKEYASEYMSEARLHDEIKYVYDRRTKEKFMGNTLEKPTMLLKREFNMETLEDSENLNKGHNYLLARDCKKQFNDDMDIERCMEKNLYMGRNECLFMQEQCGIRSEPLKKKKVNRYADIEQGDTF